MSFARPELLWLLVPAVVLLWWSARPKPLLLTTQLLLARAVQSLAAARQSRRMQWRQWLLGSALLVALLASAGPQWPADSAALVLVVDAGGSMAAVDAGVTLTERGLQEAGRFGAATQQQSTELNSTARTLRQVGKRVVVVTDREWAALPEGVGLVQIAHPVGNAGITALGLDAEGRLLVIAATRGETTGRSLEVLLRKADGSSTELLRAPLQGGPQRHVIADIRPPNGSQIFARVTPPDALRADDSAEIRRRAKKPRVGLPLVGEDQLQQAFAALEHVEILRGDGACALRVGEGSATTRLQLKKGAVGVLRRGTLGGEAAESCLGEEAEAAVAAAPVGAEVLITLAGQALLVREGEVLTLLCDPDALAGTPALPLLCDDILAQAQPGREWIASGTLDHDTTAGIRATALKIVEPAAGSAAPKSAEVHLLLLAAAALLLWLVLTVMGRTDA